MSPVRDEGDPRAVVASVLRSRRLVPSSRVLAGLVLLVVLAHAMSARSRPARRDEAPPAAASVAPASEGDRAAWLVAANW